MDTRLIIKKYLVEMFEKMLPPNISGSGKTDIQRIVWLLAIASITWVTGCTASKKITIKKEVQIEYVKKR